jgi:oligogalacturonide transporter
MIEDYTMRSKFSGVRIICSTFGAILAGLIPSIIIKDNTNPDLYLKVALIFGVIFLVVILITFFGTWEKQKPVIKISIGQSFIQSFTVVRSRAFRIFVAIFIFGQGSADFLTGLAVYYVDDVLHAYGGGHFTYLMAVILLAQFVGTILFTPIMAKTSKRFPILVGFPLRMVCTLAMLFFSYEGVNFIIILVLSFLIGLGMSASSVSIFALLTDMADVDELITTVNRPGICSGMATFIRKIGAGLVSALIGILLTMVGYSGTLAGAGEMQSAATQQGITMIYVFGPLVMMAVTLYYAKKFPMDKKEFDVIKREIARRKGEDTSTPTPEEIKVCENVTGMKFDELWNKENAFQLHTQKMKEEN